MWNKMKPWGYLMLLTIAPLLTGIGEVLSRDFPVTDKFFNRPIDIVEDVLFPSVLQPTIAMVLVGGLMGGIFVTRHANKLHVVARVGLTMFALLSLWVGVTWTYWRVISAHHSYWDLLFFPPVGLGLWTWVGMVETVGIVLLSIDLAKSYSPNADNTGAMCF
jgi:hypothetical protein